MRTDWTENMLFMCNTMHRLTFFAELSLFNPCAYLYNLFVFPFFAA